MDVNDKATDELRDKWLKPEVTQHNLRLFGDDDVPAPVTRKVCRGCGFGYAWDGSHCGHCGYNGERKR